MKANKVKAVDMVRRIRDAQAKSTSRKSRKDVIAFFRAAGEAATADARARAKPRQRRAS